MLASERWQAQADVKPPMPPNLFTTTKLNDHLYVIAPSGPDMSNVGGNIGVCISDFTNLQAAVRQEITSGKTREQAMDDVKDPEYVNYPGGTARLRTNVGIVYDQLKSRP